jgi:hypothetical protein
MSRLIAGDKLGPYEIHSAIGAGGMGEVYRGPRPAPQSRRSSWTPKRRLPAAITKSWPRISRARVVVDIPEGAKVPLAHSVKFGVAAAASHSH